MDMADFTVTQPATKPDTPGRATKFWSVVHFKTNTIRTRITGRRSLTYWWVWHEILNSRVSQHLARGGTIQYSSASHGTPNCESYEVVCVCVCVCVNARRCIQKFPDWLPGVRTANGYSCLPLGAVILWVSLMNFATIILCAASQRVFIAIVYFVIDSVRKLLDTLSYA